MTSNITRIPNEPRERYLRLPAAARLVRLPAARLRRYVHAGLVRPVRIEAGEVLFGEAELARLRKIRRLRRDLGLSPAAIEIVLRLLDELEALQAELEQAKTDQDPPTPLR